MLFIYMYLTTQTSEQAQHIWIKPTNNPLAQELHITLEFIVTCHTV
jgi:hypothetical protein